MLIAGPTARAAPSTTSLSGFRAQVADARSLVAACRGSAGACDTHTVPRDEQVQGENATPGFHAGWVWLRDALEGAAKAPPAGRAAIMEAASAHLESLASEVAPNASPFPAATVLPAAHAAALRILARDEFRANDGPTWLDRQIARIQDALLRLFSGMARVGARNGWIAPLIEWSCFALAAAGLLLFLRRSLHRQALRISLAGSTPAAADSGRSSEDWLRAADAAEASGLRREAMHCLYWAAITALDARKAWRRNPTRTPREYLRLLRPGSASHLALRRLTLHFECSWYGAEEPSAADIQNARQDLQLLETGALERVSPAQSPHGLPQSPAASTGATA